MNPTTVRTVVRDILTACIAAYGATNAPTVPANTFSSHGQAGLLPSGDYLCVWSGGLSGTHPFPLSQLGAVKSSVVPSTLITIELMRECWPAGHGSAAVKATPAASEFTDASEQLMLDEATLFSHITRLATAGTLIPSLPTINTAQDIAFSPMVPVGPLGNRVGWRWPMAVKLSVP